MSVGMVSLENAPRDLQGLLQLKRGVRSRLAAQLGLITNDQQEAAFHLAPDEESCQALQAALQAFDAAGGGPPQQLSPQPQPIPQQPQVPMQQQQFQYPPQNGAQLQLAPMQAQVMPPLQPPQQMQYPQQMQPQMPQQMPQQPQQYAPPMMPPLQPPQYQQPQMMQPQYQQPQKQVQQYAPPQYPPQQMQQQVQYQPPQMPQQAQQAPAMLPPVQMPQAPQQPQVTPPAQPQQAPVRVPSTKTDPTNAGESRGRGKARAPTAEVADPPTQPVASTPMLQIQQQVAEALQKLAETSAATQRWLEEQQVRQSQLLSAILQLQLYMAEQAGIDPSGIARSLRVTGTDTVGNYLKELEGEAEGK